MNIGDTVEYNGRIPHLKGRTGKLLDLREMGKAEVDFGEKIGQAVGGRWIVQRNVLVVKDALFTD